jgi:hypothetical protein
MFCRRLDQRLFWVEEVRGFEYFSEKVLVVVSSWKKVWKL